MLMLPGSPSGCSPISSGRPRMFSHSQGSSASEIQARFCSAARQPLSPIQYAVTAGSSMPPTEVPMVVMPRARPRLRTNQRDTTALPAIAPTEAFPTLKQTPKIRLKARMLLTWARLKKPSDRTVAPVIISRRIGSLSMRIPITGLITRPIKVPSVRLYMTCSRPTPNSSRSGVTNRVKV